MALVSCPECAHEISAKATSCPNCGHPFVKSPGPRHFWKSPFFWLIVIVGFGCWWASSSAPPAEITRISYAEAYKAARLPAASLTDAQRDEIWRTGFRGKTVRWSGKVSDVREGLLGSEVYIDMGNSPITGRDITLFPCSDSAPRAKSLRKGQTISFRAVIDQPPGVLAAMTLNNALIE